MPEKFREKYRKNQRTGSFEKSPGGAKGEPGGPGSHPAQPHPWPRQGAPGAPGPPLAAPLLLFILRHGETPKIEPYFANSPLFRRRRASEIGGTVRTLPGTLPEGGSTSGSFSSTMEASWMFHE